jgi:hypothetical protein
LFVPAEAELRAEEDVLASGDELLVRLLQLVERDVPEAVDERAGEHERARERDARERGLAQTARATRSG